MKRLSLIFTFLVMLASTFASMAQHPWQNVFIIALNDPLPDSMKPLGKVSVVDRGFKVSGGRDLVLNQAREKVHALGGNVYKITKFKTPSPMGSSSYQVWGQAYYTEHPERLRAGLNRANDSITAMLISDTAQYAVLYVYRPTYTGALLNFNVHLFDEPLLKIHAGDYDTFHIHKEGPATLWSTIETRTEVPINIEYGKAYFLRCEVDMGVWVGRPKLFLVPPHRGYKEYIATVEAKRATQRR